MFLLILVVLHQHKSKYCDFCLAKTRFSTRFRPKTEQLFDKVVFSWKKSKSMFLAGHRQVNNFFCSKRENPALLTNALIPTALQL